MYIHIYIYINIQIYTHIYMYIYIYISLSLSCSLSFSLSLHMGCSVLHCVVVHCSLLLFVAVRCNCPLPSSHLQQMHVAEQVVLHQNPHHYQDVGDTCHPEVHFVEIPLPSSRAECCFFLEISVQQVQIVKSQFRVILSSELTFKNFCELMHV